MTSPAAGHHLHLPAPSTSTTDLELFDDVSEMVHVARDAELVISSDAGGRCGLPPATARESSLLMREEIDRRTKSRG